MGVVKKRGDNKELYVRLVVRLRSTLTLLIAFKRPGKSVFVFQK